MIMPLIDRGNSAVIRRVLPGLIVCSCLAMAALLISSHYGGPVMLYALLFGISANRLSTHSVYADGVQCAASHVLRIGVALLGIRIGLGDVLALGWSTIGLVLAGVLVTLIGGWAIGRVAGLKSDFAILAAGAVAICGASAALAIAAVLPVRKNSECNLLFVIVGVTGLSTMAMLVYPIITQTLQLNDTDAGVFIGATIHDVAQVVGAGYLISTDAGDTAALVKLMRVACLVPVVITLSALWRKQRGSGEPGQRLPMLPWFLLGFIALLLLNSTVSLPAVLTDTLSNASRWCLIIAISALGAKTRFEELFALGVKPALVLVAQTVMLALFCLSGLHVLN